MPLINFRSDLTTLQYGGDRPGGGSSGQPYVVSPNPDIVSTGITFGDYYTGNRTGLDFPIRGGVMQQSQLVGTFTTPAGIIDRARIRAFLNDGSRGKIFLEKQKGLQLSNPNIQVPPTLRFQQGQITLDQALISPTRLYSETGENLLAQVGGQGTGLHLERHGQTIRLTNPFQQTYEYYASRNNTPEANRLTILAALKLRGQGANRISAASGSSTLSTQFGNANKYGISPLNTQILAYPGGPGSVYGIGFTTINRATDTEVAHSRAVELYNAFTLTYRQLADQKTTQDSSTPWWPAVQDFRASLRNKAFIANYNDEKKWYNQQGKPGRASSDQRIQYNTSTPNGVDPLNAQKPVIYDSAAATPWNLEEVANKDIIKFTFECLSNDDVTEDSSPAIVLFFRAFLTGLTDNHQGEYSSFKYMGRGETFRTYQGVDRSISFSFKIAAQSIDEMRPLYKKLNHLISQVYPDYSMKGLMRGSVVRLTIGDYLYRVPGFLESINVTVADDYPWEIGLDQKINSLKNGAVIDANAAAASNPASQVAGTTAVQTYTPHPTYTIADVFKAPTGAVITSARDATGGFVVIDASGKGVGAASEYPAGQQVTANGVTYKLQFIQIVASDNVVVGGNKAPAGSAYTRVKQAPSGIRQLPQVLDIQCSFKPIHDFLPRRETKAYPYVPFIGDSGDWFTKELYQAAAQ